MRGIVMTRRLLHRKEGGGLPGAMDSTSFSSTVYLVAHDYERDCCNGLKAISSCTFFY